MKIALITLADSNYSEILEITSQNKQDYCDRHGYDYIEINDTLDPARPTSWSKLLAVEKYLQNYCWLFWTDPDTVIVNQRIKLQDIIVDFSDATMIAGADDNGINCGVFLMRNCNAAYKLITDAYNMTQYVNHCYWEQRAIMDLQSEQYGIKLVPASVLNSHPWWGSHQYKDGDFIIHFSGCGGNCEYVRNGLREYVLKATAWIS